MEPSEKLKILFVINPKSGSRSRIDWPSTITDYFRSMEHTIEIFLLNGKNGADSLKGKIQSFNPERVIAVGGDGTVSMVAKELMGTSMAMGILPAGSANGMATELNIPDDPSSALQIILNGEVKAGDVIKINDKDICLHLGDLGINAQIVKYFEEGTLRGKLGYAKVLLKALIRKRLMHVRILSKDNEITRQAFMVVLANASKYGTGALINPDGNLYDGMFEVVIVRKLALSEFLKMFFKFKRLNPKKVEIFHAQSIAIDTSHKVHFQVDGEYRGKVNHLYAKILPGVLKLILPVKK
jgi:Sphingosine kinase and enzymes related to eukaryotic diacylglycerol kinase